MLAAAKAWALEQSSTADSALTRTPSDTSPYQWGLHWASSKVLLDEEDAYTVSVTKEGDAGDDANDRAYQAAPCFFLFLKVRDE